MDRGSYTAPAAVCIDGSGLLCGAAENVGLIDQTVVKVYKGDWLALLGSFSPHLCSPWVDMGSPADCWGWLGGYVLARCIPRPAESVQ